MSTGTDAAGTDAGAVRVQTYDVTLKRGRVLRVAASRMTGADAASATILAWYRNILPVGERMIVVGADARGNILGLSEVSRGGLHGCAIVPGEILRPALLMGASGIVIAHNHPSEDPTPSVEDREFVRRLCEACSVVGIAYLDSIVVAVRSGRTFSMEAGC